MIGNFIFLIVYWISVMWGVLSEWLSGIRVLVVILFLTIRFCGVLSEILQNFVFICWMRIYMGHVDVQWIVWF